MASLIEIASDAVGGCRERLKWFLYAFKVSFHSDSMNRRAAYVKTLFF